MDRLLGDGNILIPEGTATGCLETTGDTIPMHPTGTWVQNHKDGKAYVYVYNSGSDALTAGTAYMVQQQESSAAEAYKKNYQIMAVADQAGSVSLVVSATAAIAATKYGWAQFRGDQTALLTNTSQARAAGVSISVTGGKLATLTAAEPGQVPSTCAIVRVSNTAASSTATVFLTGVWITQL